MDGVGALGYLAILLGSLALSLVLVPTALRIAVKRQVLDHPGGYKTQAAPVPYLGGLAMLIAFASVIGGAATIAPPVSGRDELLVILAVAVGLAVVGFVDDLRGLGVTVRVVATVLAGVALWASGTGVLLIGAPWADATLTVLWVLGITHAMNLLDNMDGLSAGVATIAAITFFGIALLNGQFLVAALSLALVGVSVGFLRHNRYPAKIYMGDAGSLFLGVMLAVIGIRLEFATVVEISVFVPIVVLAVPILDTALVTITRLADGRSPFQGGSDHISHRLVRLGLPVPGAVAVVYGAALFSSWLAVALSRQSDVVSAYLMVGFWMSLAAFAGWFLVRDHRRDGGSVEHHRGSGRRGGSGHQEVAVSKVVVVGCGHWGKNLVRNFAELGALAGVVDPDPTLAAVQAEKFDVPVRDYDEVLRDTSIDAVVIAAPAVLHAGLARQALEHGKHTYVEKPLALDVDDAEQLCLLAEERGLTLMVGHLLQYHPVFLELKRMVRSGELGRLRYLYSNRLNFGKFRREENALWSFAPHDLSMILSLVGDEPDEVRATGSTFLHKTIADVTTTHLSFPGGEAAHVFVSWLHPFKEQKLVVVGERQMAVFDDGQPWDRKLVIYPHVIDWKDGLPQPSKADAHPVPIAEDEPLKLECQHFLDSADNGTRPRTDGREGLRVLKVLQAAQADLFEQDVIATAPASSPASRSDVRIHESAYVDQPSTIGPGTSIWHFSHVLQGSTIGSGCTLGQNVVVGPDVAIGDGCKIQNNVSVFKGVTLDDGVFVGPSAVFTNVTTPRAEVDRRAEFATTHVGRGATIGANATIVCGHDLGPYSFVAAGAVVATDVPAHALVAGVPAKQIGWVSHDGERLGDDLTCPRSGRRYRENAEGHLEELPTAQDHS